MSSTNYTRWWREGTVALTKNSNAVVGTSSYWSTTNIQPGDIFKINGVDYEIQSVTDDTHLTLVTPYTGETGSGLAYAIVRNFTSTTNAKVAAQTFELMYDFAHFIDKEHATITGKSAYELAKDNGFTGTESEWLNSLKAAGEWEEADTRIAALESDTADYSELKKAVAAAYESPDIIANDRSPYGSNRTEPYQTTVNFGKQFLHKSIYRGKNLGAHPTAAQLANVKNGTYEDLYLGDYWEDDIDITYPVLDGADAANGDTFTNEASGRRLVGKVHWVIVDMGYYASYGGGQIDDNPLEGAPYTNTPSFGNIVVMPINPTLKTFYKADGTTVYCYGLGAFPMNYKNSNECGYRYSIVRTKILPAIYEYLLNNWGLSADHFRWHEVFSSVNSTSSNTDNSPFICLRSLK